MKSLLKSSLRYPKLILAISLLSVSSCSLFSQNTPDANKEAEVYKVSFRQLPPDPVYNRVRLSNLPDIKPKADKPSLSPIVLDPLIKLSLKNSTLEQAAVALSSIGNYQTYTASSIAKQKISLEAYGTLDQLAQQIELKSGSHVVVDHSNREIRILQQETNETKGVEPKFNDVKVLKGEITSK